MMSKANVSFKDLGLSDAMLEAIKRMGWTKPTEIQAQAIPESLKGNDISGLAETGSGKTAAFTIPIIEAQLKNPIPHSALVLTHTLELAKQTKDQFDALGRGIGISTLLLVGGEDFKKQAQMLNNKTHHIIIATPGRFLDHIRKTKGFNEAHLRRLRHLVLDEADEMLDKDFEKSMDRLLEVLPRERITFLYSATMTAKVSAIQRAGLRPDYKLIMVSRKNQLASSLSQYYVLTPQERKDAALLYLLRDALLLPTEESRLARLLGRPIRSCIVFVRTKERSNRVAMVMAELGITTEPLNGDMPKPARSAAINRFRSKEKCALISTNLAGRGLDFVHVDLVVNYDLSMDTKEYQHRVGRTARIHRSGLAINLITQYTALMLTYLEDCLLVQCRDLWAACEEQFKAQQQKPSTGDEKRKSRPQNDASINLTKEFETEVASLTEEVNSRMNLSILSLKDRFSRKRASHVREDVTFKAGPKKKQHRKS